MTKQAFHWYLDELATKLFRKDTQIYMSEDMTQLSYFKMNDGFMTYQEKLESSFPEYQATTDFTLKSKESTKTLGFKEYIEMLCSTSADIDEFQDLFQKDSRFFD